MADITELTFDGAWRIVVQSRDAGWDQRVVAEGVEGGTRVLGGSPGMSMDVYGVDRTPWTLRIEHDPGSGWSPSWLRAGPKNISGTQITQVVESEDTTTPTSDRDFNDLVVRLEKLGMVDQTQRPFAVWPGTVQMTPEGVFETAFGRYFMAVRVRNVWTEAWPAGSRVGITDRCRSWLAAGGVTVIDTWSAADQAAVGQEVVGGRVLLGDLSPWDSRMVYFKVDVSAATVRKHQVEVAVIDPVAEDLGYLNRNARAPIAVSRTTYDTPRGAFVAECDRGTLTMAIKEMVVDYNTLKRAVGRARELLGQGSAGGGRGGGGPAGGCSAQELEQLRRRLRAFLEGRDDDVCGIWRELQCCCAGGGRPGDGGGGDWTKDGGNGLEFFAWPTVFEYRIDYRPGFEGQFGPIPYDDPWWKALLMVIAAILALAAFVSAAADLANRSADTVIGTVTRSTLNAVRGTSPPPPAPATTGSVDAAVVTLNGSRGLTAALFSYLDAAADESNTAPIAALGGLVNTPGTFLTNAQIGTLFANLAAAPPGSPAATAAATALRVFKSGARSGVTNAVMASLLPVAPRAERDGSTIFFLNQVRLVIDPAAPVTRIGRPGDSGSLWLQMGSNAVVGLNHAGCTDPTATPPVNFADMTRIQDVLTTMAVRF